ncbi:MAG: hypothetical protein PF961_06495 [Planctomycetota bacterium]|jgi:hypothetical protein|nr:hypothetical protein [Planctomycetota bacterium]
MIRILVLMVLVSLVSAASVAETAGVITDPATGAEIVRYSALIPPPVRGQGLGLIVGLHGIGGNEKQTLGGLKIALADAGRSQAFMVLGLKSKGRGWETVDHEPIRQAVAWAIREHGVDPRRVYGLGYSHGAIRYGHFAAEAQDLFAGVVLWAGTCAKIPADGSGVAYYVVHGESDPTVKPGNIRAARTTMRERGVRLVYREIRGGDHGAPYSPAARAMWGNHIQWMDSLRNARQPLPEEVAAAIAEAEAALDADGKLSSGVARRVFPVLMDNAGPAVDDFLLRCLQSDDRALLKPATKLCTVRVYGDSVIAALAPLLDHKDKTVRQQALAALVLASDFQVQPAETALCSWIAGIESARSQFAALGVLDPIIAHQQGTVALEPTVTELLKSLAAGSGPVAQRAQGQLAGF